MNLSVAKLLQEVEFGNHQKYDNLLIVPLKFMAEGKVDYICLDDALASKSIEITEVSEGGSVPELYLKNNSDKNILLLDGEELVGAKQNRILNTTILLSVGVSTKIPVSCVEAGRWQYENRNFSGSNRMSPSSLKFKKSRSVSQTLMYSMGSSFRSDQGEVWDEVQNLASVNFVNSKSNAMSDIFESKDKDINSYLDNFSNNEGQNGLAAFINGKIVGIEFISQASVFAKIYPKLVRGYAMDAISFNEEYKIENPNEICQKFIADISNIESNCFKSINLGEDCRFVTPTIAGSALVYEEEEVVHFTGLQKFVEDNPTDERKDSYIRRSRSRFDH